MLYFLKFQFVMTTQFLVKQMTGHCYKFILAIWMSSFTFLGPHRISKFSDNRTLSP